jgi:sortase (surface protein transpeptidase)
VTHRPQRTVARLLVVIALLAGCGVQRAPTAAIETAERYFDEQAEQDIPAAALQPARAPSNVRDYRAARESETVAAPARVEVPSVGISSDLETLGLADDGAIEVPHEWQQAGWYADGPRPGQQGPAVILGHVDSKAGPAVFHRLRELEPGAEIVITRDDGSQVTFAVDRVERHAKTRFPTDDVYFPTLEPTLRLVTCGGAFDHNTGHYTDNVVAFASLTSSG